MIGQSGLGKSTFLHTLAGKEVIPQREHNQFNDLSEKTVNISTTTEGFPFSLFFFCFYLFFF